MRILRTLFLAWGLAIVHAVQAVEPTCDTTFTGNDAAHPTSWQSALNWTNGIPGNGKVACIPSALRNQVELPAEMPVAYIAAREGSAAGEELAACCVADSCVVTTAAGCEAQQGYYLANVTTCFLQTCQTGACCDADFACDDKNAFNQPMTLPDCNAQNATYKGGAHCTDPDPCGFQTIPPGYEIVGITTPELEVTENYLPRITDCGEIIFANRAELFNNDTFEVFLYDNAKLIQLTSNQERDSFPDINNDGVMAWTTGGPPDPAQTAVTYFRPDSTASLGPGIAPHVNNAGRVVWYDVISSCTQGDDYAVIWGYDGETSQVAFDDGESNQAAYIGTDDSFCWTRYHFTNCDVNWTSDIMLKDGAVANPIPHSMLQAQGPDIQDRSSAAWEGHDGQSSHFEEWNGQTSEVIDRGGSPSLNEKRDITFDFKTSTTPYHIRLRSDEVTYRITNRADNDNRIDNHRGTINKFREIAWARHPNGNLTPSGIRMLRRIRTGDADLDGDVDRVDFAKFAQCYTGPGDFDRLCECRFLDIDHDRDVDGDDYNLFLGNYNGPLEDCNGNGQADFNDILFGPGLDCNRNGIPDSCDISSGSSPDSDSNGIPDDCVYDIPKPIWREIFPIWTSRFLTIVPRKEWGSVALRVTLTSLHHVSPPYTGGASVPFTAFEGQVRYVGPPTHFSESSATGGDFWAAKLQCSPHYQVWDGIDLLQVTGSEVVPSSEYHVQAMSIGCQGKEAGCPWVSEAVRIKTGRWADVELPYNPPDASVQPDFADLAALVNKFKSAPGAPIKSRALLAGDDAYGNFSANTMSADFSFTHIAACVDAFRGGSYPFAMQTCP